MKPTKHYEIEFSGASGIWYRCHPVYPTIKDARAQVAKYNHSSLSGPSWKYRIVRVTREVA